MPWQPQRLSLILGFCMCINTYCLMRYIMGRFRRVSAKGTVYDILLGTETFLNLLSDIVMAGVIRTKVVVQRMLGFFLFFSSATTLFCYVTHIAAFKFYSSMTELQDLVKHNNETKLRTMIFYQLVTIFTLFACAKCSVVYQVYLVYRGPREMDALEIELMLLKSTTPEAGGSVRLQVTGATDVSTSATTSRRGDDDRTSATTPGSGSGKRSSSQSSAAAASRRTLKSGRAGLPTAALTVASTVRRSSAQQYLTAKATNSARAPASVKQSSPPTPLSAKGRSTPVLGVKKALRATKESRSGVQAGKASPGHQSSSLSPPILRQQQVAGGSASAARSRNQTTPNASSLRVTNNAPPSMPPRSALPRVADGAALTPEPADNDRKAGAVKATVATLRQDPDATRSKHPKLALEPRSGAGSPSKQQQRTSKTTARAAAAMD